MRTLKPFWLGLVGSVVGFMVMAGMSFWLKQDVFTVDRSGTIDLRVSNTGNVGIGMQGALDIPGSRLVVKASGTGTTTSALDVQASNGTSRLFVRDDGNVGIGTTSPGYPLDVRSSGEPASLTRANGANGQGPDLNFKKARGTISSPAIVADTDALGHLVFTGYDGASWIRGARITARINGTPGTNDVPAELQFFTCSGGSEAQRMVIDKSGNVGIGTTGPDSILELGGADAAMSLNENSATPASPASGAEARIYMKADKLVIQYNDGGTVRYKYLDLTGTGVTWTHTTTAP